VLKLITDDLFSREVFDFGRMDEELQRDVITMAASNEAVQEDLRELNPFLQNLQNWNEDPALIEANKTRVFQHYREQVILDRLLAAYRGVQEHPVRMHISRSILLDLFLDPLKVSLVGIGLL
jgi:H2-forming N5,N10-methylenetetrahydromethanopterin dehydrogenase-like enzyme